MADPISVALMAAATAVSAAGSIYAGNAAAAAGQYNQQIASRNAETAAIKQRQVEYVSQRNRKQFKDNAKRLAAENESAYAKLGVDPYSGTSLMVMLTNASKMDEEIAQAKYAESVNVRGIEEEKIGHVLSGNLESLAGKTKRTASYVGAGSTLLQGATKIKQL